MVLLLKGEFIDVWYTVVYKKSSLWMVPLLKGEFIEAWYITVQKEEKTSIQTSRVQC